MPNDNDQTLLKGLYRQLVPRFFREWIYDCRHPDSRLEKLFCKRIRLAIETYLERAAREKWLSGLVLEIGSGRVTYARDVFQRYAPEVRFLRSELNPDTYPDPVASYDMFCDVTCLGLADASLDGLICSEVLEHVPNYQLALQEITRVLKSRGRLVITSPFLYPIHGDCDFWRFTPQALTLLLREQFEILDITRAPFRAGTDNFPISLGVLAQRK